MDEGMTLADVRAQLLVWLKISRIPQAQFMMKEENGSVWLRFFTERSRYSITAKPDYLGAFGKARAPLAGETWCRGRDLPDGNFTKETWDSIMVAVVKNELVTIIAKTPQWDREAFGAFEIGALKGTAVERPGS